MTSPESLPAYAPDSLYMPIRRGNLHIDEVLSYIGNIVPIRPLEQPIAMALGQRESHALHTLANRTGLTMPSISDCIDEQLQDGKVGRRTELSMGSFITLHNPSDLDDKQWYAGYCLNLTRRGADNTVIPRQVRIRSIICSLVRSYLEQANAGGADITTLKTAEPILLIGTMSNETKIQIPSVKNRLHARNARDGNGVGRVAVGPLERYRGYGTPQIR